MASLSAALVPLSNPPRGSRVAVDKNGGMYVVSARNPAEVFLYGLGQDVGDQFMIKPDKILIGPESRGFTQTREDGLCKYCQLVLLVDAPATTQHDTNFAALLRSSETCNVCQVITSSFYRGTPELVELYQQDYPPSHRPIGSDHCHHYQYCFIREVFADRSNVW
jgi:hypothetical protein